MPRGLLEADCESVRSHAHIQCFVGAEEEHGEGERGGGVVGCACLCSPELAIERGLNTGGHTLTITLGAMAVSH